MKTSSKKPGETILGSEVTNISAVGFWVLIGNKEYFIPFADYPVFKKATVAEIYAMTQISPSQLRWESLDADIEINALETPENFPLVYRA